MKQRILALLFVLGLVAILVLLNAASYVQTQKSNDSELTPNRSTYSPGATGTQAFYTLLAETGRKPVRWQEPPGALLTASSEPAVFVMIGTLRREVAENEAAALLQWVSQGGRLVIIDREPPKDLCTSTANWKISVSSNPAIDLYSVDPSDRQQMTGETAAAKPVQPSIFTRGVNAVQPSHFAGWVSFEPYIDNDATIGIGLDPHISHIRIDGRKLEGDMRSPPAQMRLDRLSTDNQRSLTAPVVHVAGNQKNLLVDVPYGSGRIVYLTDPYIVSNGGIGIVDNAQLAINLVSSVTGPVAFDEYHQGYGTNANRLFEYFQGTPVIAIFLQCALILGLIFVSQSRRFARPIPQMEPDRLSKLEYVSAMAQLQQRTKAYDLAMENIYTDFRRLISRALGFDNVTATRSEIAKLIAERALVDVHSVEALMLKCEAIVKGEPTNRSEIVSLTAYLREIEVKLGIHRSSNGKSAR